MVFVRPRSKRSQSEPPSVISGIRRVESIKMLGVTSSRKFLVLQHVDNLLAVCSQSLFALRTLRQHDLPNDALHQVFQAIVINRLSYASPVWWGFTSADNRNRLEAFVRRSVKLGIELTVQRPSPVSVTMPTTNFFHRLQATVSTCYVRSFLLNASSTIVFATEVTTFNFLIVHQSPMTKTSL